MKKCLPLLAAILLTGAAAFATDNTVVEEIIARVNNSIITRMDLQKARDQMIAEMREKGTPNPEAEADAHSKDLLRDAIDQQLLIQKAADLGITGDTELIKRLDEIRKQMNLETMEDLEKAAAQQGVSYEEFKQNLRNTIVTQAVISREVGSKIGSSITSEETKQFYDQHKAELERPEQVRLSEILIAPGEKPVTNEKGQAALPPNPSADDINAAQQKAEDVLAQLKKGTAFDELARKNSNGPTAADGGDLNYFKRGMLAKELEDKVFAMKKGETTDVIRTKQGFIILKVTDHQQAGIPPLRDVEDQVKEAIYLKKLQPALREYLTKLREDAYIDIKPGNVDTAASPNETKPVYVANADNEASSRTKIKKKKKLGLF